MKKYLLLIVLVASVIIGGALRMLSAQEVPEAVELGSDHVSITIYNRGSALVQDVRTFELTEGINSIDFSDVASGLDATSVGFVSLSNPGGLRVLEQNYVYDLVSPAALLRNYLDEVVTITTDDGSTYTGTLLTDRVGELILQQENGEVVTVSFSAVQDMRLPELPDELLTRPTLRWLVESETTGPQQIQITYLTTGMNWQADYNILLANGGHAIDLDGWVTLTNNSGASYHDATLKLVAGDVNRIQPNVQPAPVPPGIPATATALPTQAPQVQQREFFEYQLYEVARPVTIGNNATKQVEFVTRTHVPAELIYVFPSDVYYYDYGYPLTEENVYTRRNPLVQTSLLLKTDEDGGLDADLPAGRIRLYYNDTDGAALFVGDGYVDHTPKGEDIYLSIGASFNLTGDRTLTRFELLSNTSLQETYQITLRNFKDTETVNIRIPERLFRWSNWEIIESSFPYEQRDSHTIQFDVEIPPQSEVTISYTVRYTWG